MLLAELVVISNSPLLLFDVHTPSVGVQASPVELIVENEAQLTGGEHPDVVVPSECDESRNGETEDDATKSDPFASPFEGRFLASEPRFVLWSEFLAQPGAGNGLLLDGEG